VRGQPGDERVHVPPRLLDACHFQRVQDDRTVGATSHRRVRLKRPAEQLQENYVVEISPHPACVEQRPVDVPEHKEIAHV
jgi:hypothetical protein